MPLEIIIRLLLVVHLYICTWLVIPLKSCGYVLVSPLELEKDDIHRPVDGVGNRKLFPEHVCTRCEFTSCRYSVMKSWRY